MKLPSVENYWGFLLRQAPVVVFLAIAAWLLWSKIEAMEVRVSSCNRDMIELYKAQNDALMQIISRNSDALSKNADALENFSYAVKNGNTRRKP